jgi:hypothetical protein
MGHQVRSINSSVSEQIQSLRKKVEKEFGVSVRFSSHILRSSNAPTGRPPKVIHFTVLDKPALNASSEVA